MIGRIAAHLMPVVVLLNVGTSACGRGEDLHDAEASADPAAIPAPVDSRIDKAQRLAKVGQHEQAIRLLEEELADRPENLDVLLQLARILLAQAVPKGDSALLERASRTLRAALKLDAGKNTEIGRLLGYVDLRRQEIVAATETLEKCAGSGDSGCAALLLQLDSKRTNQDSRRTGFDALQCEEQPQSIPGWPTMPTTGPHFTVVEGTPLTRVDTGKAAQTLSRFEIVDVQELHGQIARFHDGRHSDSVRKTGWVDTCTASANGNPQCGCRAGASGEAAFEGDIWKAVRSSPGAKTVVISFSDALRAGIRRTGNTRIHSIGFGVNVRSCEVAWEVGQNIDKDIAYSALRPAGVPSGDVDRRADELRKYSQDVPASILDAALDGKWCRGMPIAILAMPLGIDAGKPTEVVFTEKGIVETYISSTTSSTVTSRDGKIELLSNPAGSPKDTPPPAHPAADETKDAAATVDSTREPSQENMADPCRDMSGEWVIETAVTEAKSKGAMKFKGHYRLDVRKDCTFELTKTGYNDVSFKSDQVQHATGRLAIGTRETSVDLVLNSTSGFKLEIRIRFDFRSDGTLGGDWRYLGADWDESAMVGTLVGRR